MRKRERALKESKATCYSLSGWAIKKLLSIPRNLRLVLRERDKKCTKCKILGVEDKRCLLEWLSSAGLRT